MQRFISQRSPSRNWRRQALAASPQLAAPSRVEVPWALPCATCPWQRARATMRGGWRVAGVLLAPNRVPTTCAPRNRRYLVPHPPGSPVGELAPFRAGLGRVIWKLSVAASYIRSLCPLALPWSGLSNHRHQQDAQDTKNSTTLNDYSATLTHNSLPLTTITQHRRSPPRLSLIPPPTVKLASSTDFTMMPSQRPSQLPPCPGPPPSRPLPPLPKRG
jgi:hypothetical protein